MTKTKKALVCSAMILFSSAATLSAASLNFQGPRSIPAGGPVAVIAADFNGDGKPDLFVQGWGASPQVLLSNGDGTFRTVTGSYPAMTCFSAVVADFNGDGKLDAAVATDDTPHSITVLLGEGNGKFYSREVTTAVAATGIAAGDVNGDGIPDLVIVPLNVDGQYPPLQVLLGKGNGAFQPPKTIANSLGGGPPPILVDVNHDGILDLVYLNSGGIVTQLGNGDGTFGDQLTFEVTGEPQSLAVADMNGDGKPDVVWGSLANGVCVGLGNGNGTFTSAGCTAVPYLPSSLAVADFNNDGHLDAVAIGGPGAGGPATLTVLLGKGDGTFPSQTTFSWDNVGPIAVGDWNGDGDLDLAVGNGIGEAVAITLGDGHGNFVALSDPSCGPWPGPGVAAADLNGDGKIDLAVVNGFPAAVNAIHEVDILDGNGDGTFQPPVAIQVGVLPNAVIIADVNGDGIPDLVVTDSGPPSGVWVLLGLGGGAFKPPVFYASPGLVTIVARDVNGDGVPDLIGLYESTARVVVWLGNGDGTFQAAHGFAAGVQPASMAIGHFHGAGSLDVAISDRGGNAILLLPGKGDGSFGSAITVATGMGPSGIVAGDFNGDGMTDLAVAATGEGGVEVFLGNGNGTFQPPVSFAVPGNAVDLVAEDFDGDGKLDLAVTARYKYEVIVLLGGGNGQFQVGGVFDAGGLPAGVSSADFRGDGKLDLAIFNQAPGEAGFVSIALNTSN